MIRVGDKVFIYQKPFTREGSEGIAEVKRIINIRKNEYLLKVKFSGDAREFTRLFIEKRGEK